MIKIHAGFIKKHLGYTDEEMKVWLDNPSHGCNSLHKIGQEFYFDGPGNLRKYVVYVER